MPLLKIKIDQIGHFSAYVVYNSQYKLDTTENLNNQSAIYQYWKRYG